MSRESALNPTRARAKARDSKETATTPEKLEMKRSEILAGDSKRRIDRVRRRMSWIKTGTRLSRGAVF